MLGVILFVIAFIVQLGYTIVCISKKAKQDKLKLGLLGILCIIFSFLVLLFGHGWGFQWTFLFSILGILLVSSLIQMLLLKKRGKKERPFRRWRVIVSNIGSLLFISVGLLPSIIFPPYRHPEVTGKYKVGYETRSFIDENRQETYGDTNENREVNAAFWYPEDSNKTYPLVVFSHGFSGIKNSNESTYMQLASHGYVVCSIDHPYHSFYTVNENRESTLIDQGYTAEYSALKTASKEERLKIFQKWMNVRVRDIDFTIDSIISGKGSMYKLVDETKIGVFGHSLGGAAAMGVPRVREDISAVVNIDAPMMCELTGVEDDWYTINEAPYPAPLLNIYSDYLYQNGILKNDEDYFENRLVSTTAPASFEVVFRGTQHMSLTDLTLFSPILANALDQGRKVSANKYDCLETMNNVILEFFDCYLKGTGSFTSAGFY